MGLGLQGGLGLGISRAWYNKASFSWETPGRGQRSDPRQGVNARMVERRREGLMLLPGLRLPPSSPW